MTITQALVDILQTFGILSIFLFVGTFLRAKVKIFQKLYLPACVIGGAIALVLGPNVLNLVKFSESTMSTTSAIPGILAIPVVSSIPMCLSLKGAGKAFKKKQ